MSRVVSQLNWCDYCSKGISIIAFAVAFHINKIIYNQAKIYMNYIIREDFETFAILPIVSTDDGTNSESGIGDIWLGANYSIIPEGV